MTFVGEGFTWAHRIARALIRDPKVILLDEAASALDNESEYDVLQAMKNRRGVVDMPAPGFEPKKLLGLIKHPNNSMKLEPKDDWLYGFIASAFGIVGFAIWFWALQNGFVRSLSLFADLVYNAAFGGASVGKSLWAGIVSIMVVVVVLTAAGNRLGGRKRGWMEASAYLGGTQAWFGAVYLVNGLIAFVLWKLSLVLMIGLLLLNLCTLLFAAVELHEVSSGRRFAYAGIVLGVYVLAIGVLSTMF